MLVQQATSILSSMKQAEIALVYAVAFCMLVPSATDHLFHLQPRDAADFEFLKRAQLVQAQQAGYMLSELGHALIAVFERRYLEQAVPAGYR